MIDRCECYRIDPEGTNRRIKDLAETLSIDLITAMVEENLCPAAANTAMTYLLGCMSARIYLMRIGTVEARKIDHLDMLTLPAVRAELETIVAKARMLTEENLGASS